MAYPRWPILALAASECQRIAATMSLSRLQQRIEASGAVERHQLVAAADMPAADENLRHRGASARAADRLLALGGAMRRVDLAERHVLAAEQVHGARAVGTPWLSVDFDLGHRGLLPVTESGFGADRARCPQRRRRSAPCRTPSQD